MRTLARLATATLGAAAFAATAGIAMAHHGWSWTEDGFFEVEGVVKAVYVGNPHATIDLDVEGETWRVELAPPSQTERAGFTEASASPGDELKAIGNRSREATEPRMKAVRIIVGGKTYDVYPNRVPGD